MGKLFVIQRSAIQSNNSPYVSYFPVFADQISIVLTATVKVVLYKSQKENWMIDKQQHSTASYSGKLKYSFILFISIKKISSSLLDWNWYQLSNKESNLYETELVSTE